MLSLHLPPLLHGRGEAFEKVTWHLDGPWVVVGVHRPVAMGIPVNRKRGGQEGRRRVEGRVGGRRGRGDRIEGRGDGIGEGARKERGGVGVGREKRGGVEGGWEERGGRESGREEESRMD